MIGAQLQKAIFATLGAANICGGRVYDNPPPDAAMPYVTIGDEQVLDDSNSCGEAYEVFADVHVWSTPTSGSKVELKALSAQIVPAVRSIAAVEGHIVTIAAFQTARSFRDPDGVTEHGVLTFRFLLDPV